MNTVIIRPAVPEDAEGLAAVYEPYVTKTAVTFEYDAPSAGEFRERLFEINREYPFLVAEEDGRVIGYAYAHAFRTRRAYRHTAEVSIYLDQNARGRGIGYRLYDALEPVLRRQHAVTLIASIAATSRENDPYLTDASLRFHARAGYRRVGCLEASGYKFGRWWDTVFFEKQLVPPEEDVPEFIPYPKLEK